MAHDISLQQLRFIVSQFEFDVAADPGVDAVDPLSLSQQPLEGRTALLDPRSGVPGPFGRPSFSSDGAHIFQSQGPGSYDNR